MTSLKAVWHCDASGQLAGDEHQGCVCSVINPLIAPMTLVYFIITGMCAKYSLLYIQRPAYASGGKVCSPCNLLAFGPSASLQE